MGKKSSAPAPAAPDPVATASAQAATNISTAQVNAALGNVNQVTPDGSLTYSQSGNKFVSDATAGQTYWQGPNGEIRSSAPLKAASVAPTPANKITYGGAAIGTRQGTGSNQSFVTGRTARPAPSSSPSSSQPQYEDGWSEVKGYYIPTYTATQTLSEAQQKIKDQNDAASLNLGTMANKQTAFLDDYLSKPVNLNNEAVEARLMDLGRKRLDPAIADRRAALETSLANQGIRLGSTAYATAMGQNDEATNDAYNQLLLGGRQQSIQEILTERNQPLNEINALMSGSQVSSPNFVSTNMPTVPTVDYAGLVQSNYQNQMSAWQQQNAAKTSSRNGLLGGLFGLGSSAIMASDRRLKTEIEPIGPGPLGLVVYAFRYLSGGPHRIGLMADEVERVLPAAVLRFANGFSAVNYAMVFRSETA